jgi:hypothetical protein
MRIERTLEPEERQGLERRGLRVRRRLAGAPQEVERRRRIAPLEQEQAAVNRCEDLGALRVAAPGTIEVPQGAVERAGAHRVPNPAKLERRCAVLRRGVAQ